jgi:hypothetical protein
MRYILLFTFLVFLPVLVAAEELKKEDFAFGYILETDNLGAIYSVSIPHEVYTTTAMNNLEDIRVFNSQNQVVPHEIRYPVSRDKRPMISDPVPFFPLYLDNDQNDAELSMRIETGRNGEIVNIQKNRSSSDDTPSAYLIDMKDAGTYPMNLTIQWTAEGTGILLPVILESSDDLVSWKRVLKTTLADLIFMNNRLRNGEITLQQNQGRYLRLRPDNQGVLPEISVIQTLSSPDINRVERRWIHLPFTLEHREDQTFLEAEISGRLPVDELTIEFSQPNSLLKAKVSCLDTENIWHYRGEGLFYLLTNDGAELRNEPLTIQRQNITALRLEIIEDGVGGAMESTKIKAGYVPHELLFIARGQGPFTLAYGNGNMVNTAPKNKGALLKGLAENEQQNLLRKAEVREKVILGGAEQLKIARQKPWKKIILWVVLLAGVATLAVMAWSLTRKMNQ